MIRFAERQQRRTELKVEFLDLAGERIPLADGSIDTVVSTFTLGTIPDVGKAIAEIGRVLKPDGKLIFFEVGLSPRSPSATLAGVVEANCALGVPRLRPDTTFRFLSRTAVSRSNRWRRRTSTNPRTRPRRGCTAGMAPQFLNEAGSCSALQRLRLAEGWRFAVLVMLSPL